MAEEEAEKPKEMIKLVSKEGHEFSVESPTSVFAEGDWSLFLQEALPTP